MVRLELVAAALGTEVADARLGAGPSDDLHWRRLCLAESLDLFRWRPDGADLVSLVAPDAKPFRYVGAPPLIVPSTAFEARWTLFIPRIVGRLREQDVGETNLDVSWRDVLAERADPENA